jgi:hypothetical protein
MAKQIQRIRIEEIDWPGALPWLRIFRSFRMSIKPSRMFLGLIMVGLIFGGAQVLDKVNGPKVSSIHDIRQYATLSPQQFEQWKKQYELQVQSKLYTMLTSLPGSVPGIAEGVKSPNRLDFAAQTINEHFEQQEQLLEPPVAPENDTVETQGQTDETENDQAPDTEDDRADDQASPDNDAGSPDAPDVSDSDDVKPDSATGDADTEPCKASPQNRAAVKAVKKSKQATEAAARKAAAFQQAKELYALQLAQLESQRQQMLHTIEQMRPLGVFEAATIFKIDALKRLVVATITLRGGISTVASGKLPYHKSFLGAIYDLGVVLPKWFFGRYKLLAIIWIIYALLVWSLLGGTMSRMAALQATRDLNIGIGQALKFVIRRWFTFLAVILEPMLVIVMIGGIIAFGGLLFNWPGTNVLAALLYGFALILGFLGVMVMILLGASAHLMYPVVSVESSDSFDSVSRAFNYILGRPWRWLFYNFVSMLYGAVTIGFVWLIVALVLMITHQFVDIGNFSSMDDSGGFGSIYPQSAFGQFQDKANWQELAGSSRVAANIMFFWTCLMAALVMAYVINFDISASTWTYLLLRRSADGEAMDVVFDDDLKPTPKISSQEHAGKSDQTASDSEQTPPSDADAS